MNDQKTALGQKIIILKKQRGLTWSQIAEHIGSSPVWTCAACLGQMSMKPETAAKTARLLGLSNEDTSLLEAVPYRGSVPPTDPLIYRFFELVSVSGTTLKLMIEEEFGDGMMSAIDFDMSLERVRISVTGKFLPYKRKGRGCAPPKGKGTHHSFRRGASYRARLARVA